MRGVLMFISTFVLVLTVHGQYKRFTVETNFALGNYSEGYNLHYSSWSGRLQYNFPKYFSLNLGYGQEHQSFLNTSMQDLPPGYYLSSDVRTTENFVPLTFRFTVGRKVALYAEVGAQWNFKGSAAITAFKDYWYNDANQQDYEYSYNTTLDNPYAYYENERKYNFINPIFGAGLQVPVFKGIMVYAEFRRQFLTGDEYFVREDHFAPFQIFPYSRSKFSVGLSYSFNLKKDSEFQFKTIYLKPLKTKKE